MKGLLMGIGSGSARTLSMWTVICVAGIVSLVMMPSKAFSLNVGDITTIAGNGTAGFSGDGGAATWSMIRTRYGGVAVDSVGNVYIADDLNHCIRKVDASGIITTVAGIPGNAGFSGDGGPATSAKLNTPRRVDVDSTGNLYIADEYNHRIRKVNTNGTITTVAGTGTASFSGDGGPATSAQIYFPMSVTVDSSGNLFIGDTYNHRIRKVNTNGTITTVAGTGTASFSGDGGPATGANIYYPHGVTVDSAGNLFIADAFNNRIRKVNTSGIISTVAGTGSTGFSGDGGPASAAQLSLPLGVVLDSDGSLVIADYSNNRIRKVDTSGKITSVAGTGTAGYSGDGGLATAAALNAPTDVSIDNVGNLIVADSGNARIRKVSLSVAVCNTGNVAMTISPPAGSYWETLTDNGTNVLSNLVGNTYSIADVITNHDVRATFAIPTYSIISSVNGGNGTITPLSQTVNSGNNAILTITPAAGYQLSNLTDNAGNNIVASVTGPYYIIPNVTANHTVSASFVPKKFIITASVSGGNGSVNPPSSQVNNNGSITIHVTPTAPYSLATLTDNGVDVTSNVVSGNYTINGVVENHTVVATFGLRTYTVTASATGSGNITPASSRVNEGNDAIIIITPIAGSSLISLSDNGTDVIANVINNTYTIPSISADHTVTATFSGADTTRPVLTVSTLPDGSVTNNVALNISGTVTDNVGVKDVTINNIIIPINPDGSFSYALVLNNGQNPVTIVATDLAGNKADPPNSRTITLDQTAPALTIAAPADNSKTAVSLVTVTGTASENATVVVKLGDISQAATVNGINFTADLNLVPGINTVEVIATDLAGNSSSQKRTVIYDDQSPSLAITSPNQDISTDQSGLTINGITTDPYTAVTVSITMDGQTYTPTVVNGLFEQVVTFTTAKTYAIIVTATNEVGTSTTVQRNVIYAPSADAYTKLLLHMDGDNGSATFIDSSQSTSTVTASGSAQLSASSAKFGQGGSFNGQNATYLSIANSTDWVFGNNDFTVEGWFYLSGANQPYTCLIATTTGLDHTGWAINLNSTANKIRFVAGDIASMQATWKVELTGTTTLSQSTWHHVAVTRSGDVFKLFLDGIQEATATNNVTIPDVGMPLRLANFVSYNAPLLGYLDEIRISKGIARWTSDFTPPATPY